MPCSRRPSQLSKVGAPQQQPHAGAAQDDGGDVADELEAALEVCTQRLLPPCSAVLYFDSRHAGLAW